MPSEQGPIRGRGASANPPNRFEPLHYEPDSDILPEESPGPQTQFLRDAARSILVTNDSPDVGFEVSINPYRGCEHGCPYCLAGDTLILMSNGTTRPLEDLRAGDQVYGTVRRGRYLRYVRTCVLAHWSVRRIAYRIRLGDGTCLVAGADHRFLTERGWKYVLGKGGGEGQRPYLTTHIKLMGIGTFALSPPEDNDYRTGYLCGMIRGDGLLASYDYEGRRRRGRDTQHHFRLALADEEGLVRSAHYLRAHGIPTHEIVFQKASADRRQLRAIRTHVGSHVERIRELIAWPSSPAMNWAKGFLAGIFDAEGSYSGGALRIPNTDPDIIARITSCLKRLDFSFAIEVVARGRSRPIYVVRVVGGLREHLRYFHATAPAILRKRNIEGQAVKSNANLRVVSVEPAGVHRLFDITTGTGTFIANGVVSHNCYARPTHEYLGFSAGLDFETKILVKEDAPELLRRELASPRWRPRVVGVSGVTDPYQPVERRLRLTRRCLEVLAEFRNPVAVVTKNHLVTRDADLLGELAAHQAAAVFLSVTTLDGHLARLMEPRAAQPHARLEAVAALDRVGVPVGVLVAPVIPGLTDHEMPAILEAAAAAGARHAGYVLLRLPHGVADLFATWLGQHFPDKKDRVLGRVRSLRDGRLNDARFGSRMRGEGVLAEAIRNLFGLACRKAGLSRQGPPLSAAAFCRPGGTQGLLFE